MHEPKFHFGQRVLVINPKYSSLGNVGLVVEYDSEPSSTRPYQVLFAVPMDAGYTPDEPHYYQADDLEVAHDRN